MNTSNNGFVNTSIISIKKKILKIPRSEKLSLIAINKRLRGDRKPQRCTCSTDHGFHC